MSSRRPRLLAILTLTITLAALPLGVLASHDFADVPDSNIYHADISALAASGVTTGCGGGNFCPSAFVTREQMAAFMNRLGALAPSKVPVVNAAELDGLDSSQFARSDMPVTGHANCLGSDMAPIGDAMVWSTLEAERKMDAGSGQFTCNLSIPDGSTVTALHATIKDSVDTGSGSCFVLRYALATGVGSLMASTLSSGDLATPGITVITDDVIDDAVIDNATYGYTVRCLLNAAAASLAVMATSVEYTISGLPVD